MEDLNYQRQVDEFNEIWLRRYQDPYITDNKTWSEWAKDRTEYLTFLIPINDRKIIDQVKEIQQELAEYGCIDVSPENYLHLTVKEVGCFLSEKGKDSDELTKEDLHTVVEQARDVFKSFSPFTIKLEGLNNFKSAVVIQGLDGGIIRKINASLLEVPGIQKITHDPRFLPHMSIALYRNKNEYNELIRYLEENRETEIDPLIVESVELVIAHIPKVERFPRLQSLVKFNLK